VLRHRTEPYYEETIRADAAFSGDKPEKGMMPCGSRLLDVNS